MFIQIALKFVKKSIKRRLIVFELPFFISEMFAAALLLLSAVAQPLVALSITRDFVDAINNTHPYADHELTLKNRPNNKLNIFSKWNFFSLPKFPGFTLRSRADSTLCDDSVPQVSNLAFCENIF